MAGEYINPMGSYPKYNTVQRLNPFDELRARYEQELKSLAQQMGLLQQPVNQCAPLQSAGLTVRRASNIHEVQSCFIEPLTTNVFVNLAQGEIYLSRINDSGLKDVQTFRLSTEIADSVVKESLTTPAQIDLSEIHGRFDRIENLIGGKSNEPDAAHGTGNAKRRRHGSSYESGSDAAVGSTGAN